MVEADRDSAGVRFPPPLAFVAVLIGGWLLGKALGQPGIPFIGGHMTRNLGWFAFVAGAAIMLTAIGLFRRADTNTAPWKTATSFVTDGVYRWTRNPMYLGMALIYAGIALILDAAVALILLIPLVYLIQREVIEREERYMEAKFGDPYRTYKASVRRWM